MVIDEIDVSSKFRLKRILKILESLYSVTIDFNTKNNETDLRTLYDEYGLIRHKVIRESKYNSYNQHSEYTKACLIQEAIHIFLSEIAPKRRNKKSYARGAQ